ncbi:helix-turn-helix domain-containing protein [Verrucomicrobia bacterium]|nr:helix-turn-helix domain-containing protein [Verrucomicrobiota bacterium]
MNQRIRFEDEAPHALLNRKQVAERLGVHFNTVYRLTKRDQLPCVRIGKRTVRFTEEAVQAYLDSNTWNMRP